MFGLTESKQITELLKTSVGKKEIAGGNLLIIKEGVEIFYHEDGFADIAAKIPIKRDSIFRLYSMSKPVTAASVMLLLERGVIDLYEPVSKYLPGFKNQMVVSGNKLVPAEREVTIKDLLSMTSGLVYGGTDPAGQDTESLFKEIDDRLFSDSPMSTAEAMNKLGRCPLAYQPGSFWQYGTSADVLGAVVEAASGKSFGEFLKKEIFEPLGMTDTGFWVEPDKRSRLVKTYADNGEGGLKLYTGNHLGIIQQMDREPAFESGGAGLVSTIDDYAKFANMLMREGNLNGVTILKPRTVKYLTSGTLNETQQRGFDLWQTLCGFSYGNLMRVMKDSSKAGDMGCLSEYGWDGWLGAYFCNCPKEKLTILFMMQKTDTGTTSLTRKLRNIILSSQEVR
ncbi:serine hydrolase domain-containing protein [Anaerocolumna sp. MB42-C2]|uniref:serine hydrolase domain-containing protein n=1 Tax=Anaerocolumna sp. MB42-C2 TaxID=3070997 RepID=UPI0027DEF0CE|nr:serine hydrolase domain-containing protein [Anaerocolumna sp. MB42-C2]WMJ89013.1 serine hydrolase domain-containing protein [Anaerocolumna sp. MB42-C2]